MTNKYTNFRTNAPSEQWTFGILLRPHHAVQLRKLVILLECVSLVEKVGSYIFNKIVSEPLLVLEARVTMLGYNKLELEIIQ